MASSSTRRLAATPETCHEAYCVPPFPSNAGGREILEKLLPLLDQYYAVGNTGVKVNAGVPLWDPWNIPGMPLDEDEANRREKYYVTDCSALKCDSTNPATQTGYWKPRDLGWGIPGERIGLGTAQFSGLKTTYDFHIGDTIYQEGSKGTSWIMDVYSLIDKNGQVQDALLMCHVFKGKSRDYDPRPRCAAHHHHRESPKEKEIHGQSNNSLLERPGGLLATHISSNKHLSPSHQQASIENGSLAQQQGIQLPNHGCNQKTEFLATHINSNKHLSPPDHVPQLGSVSHHQASKENGSLAPHHQGFQLPNHGCNQNSEFLATHINLKKHLSPPDHAPHLGCVSHHQACNENVPSVSLAAHYQGFQLPNHGCNQNTGEPINHKAISQNNDNFDMGFLKQAVLDSDMEEVTEHTSDPVLTYFGNLDGVTDIGLLQTDDAFFPLQSNDLAEENTGVEISMEMIQNDIPNGGSSRVLANAENGPLGKRARTTSAVWEKFTKVNRAKMVLAVCNHCYKVMTGNSSKGTSHLKRHKCHCNH